MTVDEGPEVEASASSPDKVDQSDVGDAIGAIALLTVGAIAMAASYYLFKSCQTLNLG